MEEAFLHFIWKFQKFDTQALCTEEGEPVIIYHPGQHNHDAGPDFLNARLKIGALEWTGHVEIHLRASDWRHHRHEKDAAYNNVVLHVVWTADEPTLRHDGTPIPTLTLHHRVPESLLAQYRQFFAQGNDILCADQLQSLPDLTYLATLDQMLALRLEEKARRIATTAEAIHYDWEETAYRLLARTFGFSLNADTFQRLAESLPLKIIAKHTSSLDQVQALVFGMAGFLDEPADDYAIALAQEFAFLVKKYDLRPVLHRTHWKFGKMRPSNFPTIRLAQFAAILAHNPALFSSFLSAENTASVRKMLRQPVHEYWAKHYDFGKESKRPGTQLGDSSVELLIINAVVPMLAAYSHYTDQQGLMDRAVHLLEALPAERNRYTNRWADLGRTARNAFDSQAQITLTRDYCMRKNCLNCTIGTTLFAT